MQIKDGNILAIPKSRPIPLLA